MKLPPIFEPIVFGLLLSGLMSLVVSGIATWNALGFVPNFAPQWLASWLFLHGSWVSIRSCDRAACAPCHPHPGYPASAKLIDVR